MFQKSHLDACIYYLICEATSWWLGHTGDLERSVSSFLLRGFIRGQVMVARQKATRSLFYSENFV